MGTVLFYIIIIAAYLNLGYLIGCLCYFVRQKEGWQYQHNDNRKITVPFWLVVALWPLASIDTILGTRKDRIRRPVESPFIDYCLENGNDKLYKLLNAVFWPVKICWNVVVLILAFFILATIKTVICLTWPAKYLTARLRCVQLSTKEV